MLHYAVVFFVIALIASLLGFGGGLGWLIGIGSLAIGGVGPFIAARPIMAALAGVAVGTAAEIHHDMAEKVGATLRAAAPQPTSSANGPSACPLCCARSAVARGRDAGRLSVRKETAPSLLRGWASSDAGKFLTS